MASWTLDGKGDGFHYTGEFHQRSVAHQLNGTAVVLARLGLDKLFTVSLEGFEGTRLVYAHEA
jgi:hypothetical protein